MSIQNENVDSLAVDASAPTQLLRLKVRRTQIVVGELFERIAQLRSVAERLDGEKKARAEAAALAYEQCGRMLTEALGNEPIPRFDGDAKSSTATLNTGNGLT